ncbi:DNA polymerase III delta prime subunit [Alkalibacterium sp. AK22]|uniref:DNA polymerase III subunit delta' n=1 Tax=Alkalibacterium sp. AK22 TaxID=1229520 RepID=UPI00044BF0DE|nr:DNA polymerase III subunit delta' [Alkalibacterium sp. AK22]EXJ23696.1 DNA polymerase III delta prime subunit [Alkalibacterium sp. AK22]
MSTLTSKQPSIQRLFLQLLKQNTLQHAYIFEGKAGTGKKEMALWITQSLFCPVSENGACGECQTCRRVKDHHHPDVVEIQPDGQSIKIGQVRALKEEFTKSGMESRRKIVIVQDVEKMTVQAANSLLKFLEEPDGDITVFLLTTARHRVLSTIQSRCQLIHFPQLSRQQRVEELTAAGISDDKAAILSQLTSDTSQAVALSKKEELLQLVIAVWKWYSFISKKDDQAFVYVQTDLIPLAKEKEEQQRVLDLMIILLQDLLNIRTQSNYSPAFVKQVKELEIDASRFRPLTVAQLMEVGLTGKKLLDSNVAAQGVFEDCALQMLAVIRKNG